MNPERLRQAPHIAIVGSSSPLGRELKESIEASSFPVGKLSLIDTEEYAGLLQEFAGEIRITQILSPESFADTDIAFFACGPEIIGAYASSGAAFPPLTIDLTQTGREGILFLNGISNKNVLRQPGYYINPHPATIAIARILARIRTEFRIQSASITALDPASERGSAGVNELQEQTVGLLNFQTVESKTFGGQLAFNLLAEIQTARRTEALIRSQLGQLLGDLNLGIAAIQAPVFHSHAFSMFLKLDGNPTPQTIASCLEAGGAGVKVHDEEGLSPSPVAVVGSDVVHVVRIDAPRESAGSCFLWIVADNSRLAASNALQIAEHLMLASTQPN